jgi:hypothetical protein
MTPQKLVVLFASLTGGAIGPFAPVGAVKWLMQIEPEEAGIRSGSDLVSGKRGLQIARVQSYAN